jgi:hypothetical protein
MVEILRAPDGVAVAVAYLRAQFTARGETAVVGSKIRDPRPAKFVKVRLMGGVRTESRYAPMLVFECWGRDDKDDITAQALGSLTEALMDAMPDLHDACTRVVEVGGLVDQPDPATGAARYVFTKQIYLPVVVLT